MELSLRNKGALALQRKKEMVQLSNDIMCIVRAPFHSRALDRSPEAPRSFLCTLTIHRREYSLVRVFCHSAVRGPYFSTKPYPRPEDYNISLVAFAFCALQRNIDDALIKNGSNKNSVLLCDYIAFGDFCSVLRVWNEKLHVKLNCIFLYQRRRVRFDKCNNAFYVPIESFKID